MKKISLFLIFVLITFLAATSIYLVMERNSPPVVMNVSGEKVGVPEYRMYLYTMQEAFEQIADKDIWETEWEGGRSTVDVAKEQALNSVLYTKVTLKAAKKMNITLTAEETERALLNAGTEFEAMDDAIVSELDINLQLMETIFLETMLYAKVRSSVVKGFEPSEIDFMTEVDQYLKTLDDPPEGEELDQLIDVLLEEYVMQKQDEIFDMEFAKWAADLKVTTNDVLIKSIDIIR